MVLLVNSELSVGSPTQVVLRSFQRDNSKGLVSFGRNSLWGTFSIEIKRQIKPNLCFKEVRPREKRNGLQVFRFELAGEPE